MASRAAGDQNLRNLTSYLRMIGHSPRERLTRYADMALLLIVQIERLPQKIARNQ